MAQTRSDHGPADVRPKLGRCLGAAVALYLLAGPVSTQTADPLAGQLDVEVAGDLVRVSARGVTLSVLLEELASKSHLHLETQGPLADPVTVEIEGLPLADALRRLLPKHGFVLRGARTTFPLGQSSNATLWVFSTAEDRGDGVSPLAEPTLPAAARRTEQLQQALEDGDPESRLRAASELANVPPREALQASLTLATAALADDSVAVRLEAVYALGEIGGRMGCEGPRGCEAGGASQLQILELALGDPDRRVREAAVAAAVDIGGDEAAWILAQALSDPSPSVREDAVFALGEIGGDEAAGILQQAMADEEDSIREAAAEVLSELSD